MELLNMLISAQTISFKPEAMILQLHPSCSANHMQHFSEAGLRAHLCSSFVQAAKMVPQSALLQLEFGFEDQSQDATAQAVL